MEEKKVTLEEIYASVKSNGYSIIMSLITITVILIVIMHTIKNK